MKTISTLFLVSLFFSGCSFREDKNSPSTPFTGKGSISFAIIQQEILKPNCATCHSGNHSPVLTNYAQVKDALAQVEDAVLIKKTMPARGPLPDHELSLLRTWIDNGAPEFVKEDGPAATPTPGATRPVMKWAEACKLVFKPKCFNCHFKENPDKISDLEDYDSFVGTVGTSYFVSVINPAMPPPPKGTPEGEPNPNKLTREEMEVFSNWIVDGMQR